MRLCLRYVCLLLYMTPWMPHGKATGQCHSRPASNYNKALKGHTFETFKADRPTDCVIKCENEPRCQSYNFVIGEKICELNNRTKKARPEDFVTDPTRIYMTVKSNRVPLGSTRDMPAVSCEEVKTSEGEAALCKNWVKPNSSAETALINCYLEAKVYRMIFPSRSTENYALKANAIKTDLTSLTLCLFVKHASTNPPGTQTVFSYATSASYNMMFITTPSIPAYGIYNNWRQFSSKIEDVNWHHICATWDNTEGNYQLYMDSQLTDSGAGLMKGFVIPRGGTFVLGQDQDSLGGGFQTNNAFGPGQVTEVNLWSNVLSGSEISVQYQSCHIPPGSVFAWPQFKNVSYGALQVYEP